MKSTSEVPNIFLDYWMTNANTAELLRSRPVWITHDEFSGGVVRADTHDTQLTGKKQKKKEVYSTVIYNDKQDGGVISVKRSTEAPQRLDLHHAERRTGKERWYILPSQVQCSRFKAPSALFQCCRWKKAYATASLSPLFKMCSGGRIRLFISNKYCRQEKEGLQDTKASCLHRVISIPLYQSAGSAYTHLKWAILDFLLVWKPECKIKNLSSFKWNLEWNWDFSVSTQLVLFY